MISDDYRKQNEELHRTNPEYGSGGGKKYAEFVLETMRRTGSNTVLDYGCGKGSLRNVLGPMVNNYDPAIQEWSSEPAPADLVVCTDVLEHIEPEYLDEVIEHIRKLSRKAAFFVISCRKASKILPDGRNAHLTVQSAEWWIKKLACFKILTNYKGKDELMMVCK